MYRNPSPKPQEESLAHIEEARRGYNAAMAGINRKGEALVGEERDAEGEKGGREGEGEGEGEEGERNLESTTEGLLITDQTFASKTMEARYVYTYTHTHTHTYMYIHTRVKNCTVSFFSSFSVLFASKMLDDPAVYCASQRLRKILSNWMSEFEHFVSSSSILQSKSLNAENPSRGGEVFLDSQEFSSLDAQVQMAIRHLLLLCAEVGVYGSAKSGSERSGCYGTDGGHDDSSPTGTLNEFVWFYWSLVDSARLRGVVGREGGAERGRLWRFLMEKLSGE